MITWVAVGKHERRKKLVPLPWQTRTPHQNTRLFIIKKTLNHDYDIGNIRRLYISNIIEAVYLTVSILLLLRNLMDISHALKDTENSLRDFIAFVLTNHYGSDWEGKCGVSNDRLLQWKKRK